MVPAISRDANPLSKPQDRKLKEIEGDIATEDGINHRCAARVKGDRVLPEADRLPVYGDLHANEERNNECADAQDTTPYRSCRATATSACTEEIAQGFAKSVDANLTALVHQRLALGSRRLLTRLAWRCTATSCNHGRDGDHQEEEDQRRKSARGKERPLNLQTLPEDVTCSERLKPARIGQKADDRSADQEEPEEGGEEE